MSASSKKTHPLTKTQRWLLIGILVLSAAAALFSVANVAGPHGKCPGETQTSRPGNAQCYGAYQMQKQTGVVG